ncbi:MAG: glycosyltransferase family 39 protein [Pseudomonadota bacterium]|nr:glycosyltransferase family 39 protein [Pseudomonadota bacterium]
MDRDEARFATASKTMLLNDEFIDIRMGDEPRYKKPIGIYWAQIFSNHIFGSPPYDEIWIYRLPSIFGIFFCLILSFFFIKRTHNENVAFLSVFFLIFSILTISEAHQAKTDGLLFLTISFCNLVIYQTINKKKISKNLMYLFWVSLAIGILLKGPIILIFTFLPLLIFSIITKKNYFKSLSSFSSIMLFFLISVPWFVLITIKSKGLFWQESIGNDLFNKIKSGQESHGFLPGYYSVLIFLFFWPGSIFLYSLVNEIKLKFKEIIFKDESTLFLILNFIVPFIFYELIPTKLPHYIFPSYLALSILISNYIVKNNYSRKTMKFSLLPLIIFPLAIISFIIYAVISYSNPDAIFFSIILLFLILTVLLIWANHRRNVKKLLVFSGIFQILNYLMLVFFLIPRLDKLWIAVKINNIISIHEKNVDEIYTLGFNEPSLLFLTSHKSKDLASVDLKLNKSKEKKIMLVITSEHIKKIEEEKLFNEFFLHEEFSGFNYSRGKEVRFKVYRN